MDTIRDDTQIRPDITLGSNLVAGNEQLANVDGDFGRVTKFATKGVHIDYHNVYNEANCLEYLSGLESEILGFLQSNRLTFTEFAHIPVPTKIFRDRTFNQGVISASQNSDVVGFEIENYGDNLDELSEPGIDQLAWDKILIHYKRSANTLAYLHSKGIVFGDFKPGQVMVNGSGQTTLIDYGGALVMKNGRYTPFTPTLRPNGEHIAYTIQYAAPEVLASRLEKQDFEAIKIRLLQNKVQRMRTMKAVGLNPSKKQINYDIDEIYNTGISDKQDVYSLALSIVETAARMKIKFNKDQVSCLEFWLSVDQNLRPSMIDVSRQLSELFN